MTREAPGTSRIEWIGVLVLTAFTIMSTIGYGTFALRPQNLPPEGFALRFYSVSFQLFAQLHIVLAFSALALVLVRRTGRRWIPGLIAVYVLSFLSEHIGTGYGIPFGGYGYTGLLGARIGPRVPILIPLSWFLMSLPSWVIARALAPGRLVARIALGALGLVLWDLALDPAMSALTPYWRWEETGPYYGMPWMNLVGWFVTGVVLMIALERISGDAVADRIPVRWASAFYAVVVALPLGMLGAAGEWLGVGTTLTAYLVVSGIIMAVRSVGVRTASLATAGGAAEAS